jgi:thymidylate synthase (FAD)
MTPVTPKIFFLGEPKMHLGSDDDPGVEQWLRHIGGDEALACMEHVEGADIEKLIELLARRCYKSYAPGLNPNVSKVRTDSTEYHGNILKSRHGSVTAHGHVHYAFEDVSRVFSHEIVRNATGTERSQESLRYVRLTDLRFWIPPIIESTSMSTKSLLAPPILAKYGGFGVHDTMHLCPVDIFKMTIEMCEWAQKSLAEYYDIDNIKDFETKKKLTSAFRRVAPIGLATGIGMSFNLRALRWIIEQRTHESAEEEIRLVFGLVAEDAIRRWPKMFQDFEKIDTGDGLHKYVPKYSKI